MSMEKKWTRADYAIVVAVMGLMGAYYWAIRGTTGYGGETGGMLAGFGWALLWYGFSQTGEGAARRPYGRPWLLLAITLGIAFGGFTGYGVYISWLNGRHYLNYPELPRAVAPWTGYAMLFLCGLHWGGNTGCAMAWCAPERPLRARDWMVRIACGVAGAVGAGIFVRVFPQLFLPFYSEGIYSVPEYKTCLRAQDSIRNIAPHVGLFLGFLAFEIARRDRRAVAMILTLGLGFAIPFAAGGYWQTFHDAPLKLGWWKNWEMSIGLGGGLAFGAAFWCFNRPGAAIPAPLGPKARAFFRSGLPLWLPSVAVLQGLYDGVCQIHGADPTTLGYAAVLGLPTIVLLAAWAWRRFSESPEAASAPYRLSFRAIAVLQILIILAGVAVTIPLEWRLANTVLAALYAGYLGISAILLVLFWRRQCQGA
jgi:hypothetical protein